ASYRHLRRIDATADVPEEELKVLSAVPLFSPLPVTTLERLAGRLRTASAAANTQLVEEGDDGDLFYVIKSGTVDVSRDGRHLATLGPMDFFGEIALLHDTPRVATCRATTDVVLYTLE